jgi:hypothetical protein
MSGGPRPAYETLVLYRALATRASIGPVKPEPAAAVPWDVTRILLAFLITGVLLDGVLLASSARAADEATELAKKTQNPVADLISVPLQSNFNFDTGTKDATVYVLNVQPVIPIKLTRDWNLITRTIVPIINQPSLFEGPNRISGSAWGLADINASLFLSPAQPGALIWGVGPTFTLPTATDWRLGSGKFSLGPTAVALTIQGPWVLGALISNQWSVAGWGDRDVNQMLLQPFVNYNLGKGWYLTSGPVMTANWEADSGEQWTVPVGGGVGRLFKVGPLPINTSLQAYYNVEKPRFGSEWQLRFQVQFLLPGFK